MLIHAKSIHSGTLQSTRDRLTFGAFCYSLKSTLVYPYKREIDAIICARDNLVGKMPATVAASRGGYNSYRSELSVFHDL